ncbi:MAG: hypothetical protein NWF00_10980 [Candidatus Bathyarchaeota archaeon]|nr:hypothetical protein [Candidatus Bathyarchaeota archaeon]
MIAQKDNEKRIIELLSSGKYATVGWIAGKLGVCWSTAKIILLDMAAQGKLNVTRTSFGYIFTIKIEVDEVALGSTADYPNTQTHHNGGSIK